VLRQEVILPSLTAEGALLFPAMRGVSLTGVVCAALAALFLAPPSDAMGSDLTFTPQIDYTEGYLEVGVAAQNNENTQNGKGTRTTGTALHEIINLTADGHVYHPRFLQFHTRLWGGMNQESDNGRLFGSYRSTDNSWSYELRGILLPEHPYNLELFKLHQESALPSSFLRTPSGSFDEQGAIFNYRSNPYFFHSSYVETTSDSASMRVDSQTYRLNGSYAGPSMSDTAAYSHTDSVSSSGLTASREEMSLGNNARYANFVLYSRVSDNTTDQQQPTAPGFQTSTFTWTERLTGELPGNVRINANFERNNNDSRTEEGPLTPERDQFNRATSTALNVNHRLYQSLATNYNLNRLKIETNLGEGTTRSESLNTVYTKTMPLGRFSVGGQVMDAESERSGSLSILNEVHQAPLFGPFTLAFRDVTESTITVKVKDPATNGLVVLPPSGYIIGRLGNSVEITVINVSPLVPQPDPLYVYEFQVSYSLIEQSRFTIKSWGYSTRLDLIDNLLGVYYNYVTTNREVLTGTIENGTGRDTNETAGIAVQSGPYSGLIEHQQFRSWQNPYEKWKTTGRYQTPLADNTNLTALATYELTDYFASPSAPNMAEVREKRLSVNITADRRFPLHNLNLFLTAYYYRVRSFVYEDSLTVNTYAIWQLGLLTVNGGIALMRDETAIGSDKTVRLSQYYYVTVSRKVF
jgi:hypothetical protein